MKLKSYSAGHLIELVKKYMVSDNSTEEAIQEKVQNLTLDEQVKIVKLENEDKQSDQQRYMVWFALFGMLLYPLFILIADWFSLGTACSLLASIAPTYFVSTMVIVIIFFGATNLAEKLISIIKKD